MKMVLPNSIQILERYPPSQHLSRGGMALSVGHVVKIGGGLVMRLFNHQDKLVVPIKSESGTPGTYLLAEEIDEECRNFCRLWTHFHKCGNKAEKRKIEQHVQGIINQYCIV